MPLAVADNTALEVLLGHDTPAARAARAFESATAAAQSKPPKEAAKALEAAGAEMERTGAWRLVSDAEALLTSLGLSDRALRCRDMSGGQRRRVALAAALLG